MPIVLNYTGLRITDAIAGSLSTSLAAYNAAADNTYVKVTAAEFDVLETITGMQAYGIKRTDSRWGDGILPGTAGFTNTMFRPNQALVGLIPYAFMTKLTPGLQYRVQLTRQAHVLGSPGQVVWVADSVLFTPAAGEVQNYFVLKRPTNALPADTNIAIDGFENGWGSTSGGSGIENATTGTQSGVTVADSNRTGIAGGTVSALTTGAPSNTAWTNYRILLAPKQW